MAEVISNTLNESDPWRSGVCRSLLLAAGLAIGGLLQTSAADSTPPISPPPFKQLRYDENYAYLRDPSRRSDYLDAVKFIPLNATEDWYLTLGGEVRERYEYY